MESQELKRFVNAIFNDQEIRMEFLKDPDTVISRFSLTKQEKRSVLNSHARLNMALNGSQQLTENIDPTAMWC
jgi:hypothetical protein